VAGESDQGQVPPAPTAESLLEFVQRVQQDSLARGHRFLTDEEHSAWIEMLSPDDDRIERAYEVAEKVRRRG